MYQRGPKFMCVCPWTSQICRRDFSRVEIEETGGGGVSLPYQERNQNGLTISLN